jgi:flagellar protein FlhE
MKGIALRRCIGCLASCAAALASCAALAADGSWSGSVEGPRIAGPDRIYASAPLMPPILAAGARIRSVRWRYALPPGRVPMVRLCVDRHCVPLGAARGSSDALAGWPADAPLDFRFHLPPGARTPVQVGAIQLLVDYR